MSHDIQNVTFSIQGTQLVTVPDWKMEDGKLYGLCGETGSGKSTIGRWLGGVEPVYWEVETDHDLKTYSLQYGNNDESHHAFQPLYLLQDAYQIFNPYMPIGSHFRDVWKNNKHRSPLHSFEDVHKILTDLGIEDPMGLFRRKVHQISQGEAQRMAFVLSFIRPASLRVFDEMFSNVDEASSRKMLGFLRDFCNRSGQPALVISHETGILTEFVDSIYLIRDGVLEKANIKTPRDMRPNTPGEFPGLLTIRDLVVTGYGYRSDLEDSLCSLSELMIGKGESVGLHGASGLGKTTLLKGLLGEHELQWTSMEVHSIRNPEESEIKGLDIRYLPQSVVSAFNPARTIGASLTEIQDIHQVTDPDILKWLSLFGLSSDDLLKYPNELSGGEIQRMGIISVLLGNPDLILLDESFSSVDQATRESIWAALMDRQRAFRFGLLVVSHDLGWLNEKMNRVYKLERNLSRELNT